MIAWADRIEIKRIRKRAAALKTESDGALAERMTALRGQPIRQTRTEAYALVCEAFCRAMGITPYDEQLAGALAMARGCVAQMNTGEGKTVTAVFPSCLYALAGGGAHIATVNPYLAKRDCEWMRPVYELLGFSVGVTLPGMTFEEKKAAYACDVLYGTHSEFGFDYLRDQLAASPGAQVQRAPSFMLVDEADSILLDEAVTPMILSGQGGTLDPMLLAVDRFVGWLKKAEVQALSDEDEYLRLDGEVDYIVVTRDKVALLTSLGEKHAEQFFRVKHLSDAPNIAHLIYQAIQAHGTLRRDVDYIVQEGKLQIVDPHTGRVLDGRRYSNGLWQALQVKEKLDVVRESVTAASISYQQYFRRYPLLCGMTGTAKEGRREFGEVYGMAVRVIPPHRKSRRVDAPDIYSGTRAQQLDALAERVADAKQKEQPCLIVTRTVEDSEAVSAALEQRGIVCEVLNARDNAREAEIIAQAGQTGSVTVATALAGRGTDIKLDEAAGRAGGLLVVGFGHQNTRRGDRQLMGRSGRQGDPGESCFFVSPEDDILARFGPEKPLKGRKACVRAIRRAQQSCEEIAKGQRETTLSMDEVIGRFRQEVYDWRNRVLRGEIPPEYAEHPPALVRAVTLAKIDEGWAAYLREIEDARERCGVVSLVGRDYRVEYIKEVSAMYETMLESVRAEIARVLAGVKEGVLRVDTV